MFAELKETIGLMTSPDYKKRFIAEYWQAKIRYEKLKNFCNKIEAANLDESGMTVEPEHDCGIALLRDQLGAMGDYLFILELRAIIEHIDLEQQIRSNDAPQEPEGGDR